MTAERVTLDTNLVFDYWYQREPWVAHVHRILELSDANSIEVAVTRYVHLDISFGPLAEKLNELPALGITETGGMFTLDESSLGSADLLGAREFEALYEKVVADRGDDQKLPGDADWKHLHAHLLNGRDWFITRDGPVLALAEELGGVGIRVISSEDYVRRW